LRYEFFLTSFQIFVDDQYSSEHCSRPMPDSFQQELYDSLFDKYTQKEGDSEDSSEKE